MRKWWPLVAVCLGAFILLVDVTIVNVALPQMAEALDAPFSSLQWVVDAYALSLAALLLAAGSIADLHGHRKLYVSGLALFALASLACGLAPNAGVLVAARAVQGAGGAAMFATSAALLGATYQGRDRGTAFGIWGAVNGAAAATGPILGGLLTEHIGWQAIFLVNLPVAAVAVLLTLRVIRPDRTARPQARTGRVDVPGAVTFTLAAAAVTYGLIRSTEAGWTSATVLASFAVAAASLIAFVLVETRLGRRGGQPMLDLALLRRPSFAGLMGGALLLQGGAFGCLVLVSLWLQSVLGLGPVEGGLALTPMAVVSFLVAAIAGRHIQRLAPRLPIGVGLLLIAAGMYLLYDAMSAGATASSLVTGLAVGGAGVGLATPVLVSAATGSVPPQRMGMAAGAVNTFRQLGMTLAIAVLGAVFTHTAQQRLSGLVPDAHGAASALAGGQAQRLVAAAPHGSQAEARELVHRVFADGMQDVFLCAAAAAVVGGLLVLALVRPAPTHPAPDTPGTAGPAKEPASTEEPATATSRP